ncbi:acyl-CoA N-acyltransferase [Yarrowia lipolytica]|jgi:glucosamine-phosphate N-acetyltransferase|nr:hypothetical protein YALI1_D25450g [Yarrowia lipolytica]KAB8285821.1 acyl-CoA N-acyltransferase [Yarrowia lipolytica]KAE8171836.1 acyl-CoA N-acyltransferase [Yarrowia lipolytica]RDW26203.1 acyl-CoA N-acyltransferase [Yarrowia lipolytica]RDW32954.1 acyl-CoA N-acyltransferase [Yarrowia lipolytica]
MLSATQHTPYTSYNAMDTPLFNAALIPKSVEARLPPGYTIRPLQASDYHRGVLQTLAVLTTVGDISESDFIKRFQYWQDRNDTYYNVVIVNDKDRVVAIGSVVIERKLIHHCASAGHIEDIAVASSEQGKKLGLHLINTLTAIAEQVGAYKVILDCSDKNVPFYEKCGYTHSGNEMVLKFKKPGTL